MMLDKEVEVESQSLLSLKSIAKDPRHTSTRFYMLTLSCFICIGSYFVYDNPAALETDLELVKSNQALGIDAVQFSLLYSVYSLPNILFPIMGGFLIDKLGVRKVLLYSSLLIAIGQALFAIGAHTNSFGLALLGRGIFGCGGENLDMAQSVIVLSWFSGREISMAFGMNSMASLLGSVINDNIEPSLVKSTNSLAFGLWVGFFVCVFSFGALLLLIKIDEKRLEHLAVNQKIAESFEIKDLDKFDSFFWLLLVNCIALDSSVYCYTYIASGYLQDRFGYSTVESGSIMSLIFFSSAILSPFIGIIVDKVGRRGLFLIASPILVLVFHVFCMFSVDGAGTSIIVFFAVVLGIAYAIFVTVFWASLAYVMNPKVIGTAYGIIYALENLSLVIFPIITGFIQENTEKDGGYFWVSFFLGFLAFCGIITALALYFEDLKNGGTLNNSNWELDDD